MSADQLRYDLLAQDALRGMIRGVLADVARKGLPGDHHFYITFDTRAEGVRLSPRLLDQYPKQMTIVLQHQFWDLKVSDAAFEVGLSFNGVGERLLVPFKAIMAFVDPSVQFALQFETIEDGEPAAADASTAGTQGRSPAKAPNGAGVSAIPVTAGKPAAKPRPATEAAPPSPPPDDDPDNAGGAQVVRLDRFRKK